MPAPVPDRIGPERSAGGSAYRYRLADSPKRWHTMIAPGCDLAAALHAVQWQFGAERVLEVVAVVAPSARTEHLTELAVPPTRHRWEKTSVHRYRCRRCGIIKRNWIDPQTLGWFQTYQRAGERPFRSERTPACQPTDPEKAWIPTT